MPTQQEFNALVNSPSFNKKLKVVQAQLQRENLAINLSKAVAAKTAAKKFNLCDSYVTIKPYLQLAMPLLGLIDKKISSTIQQFITGADAGCNVQ